jgi:hypothetical protein
MRQHGVRNALALIGVLGALGPAGLADATLPPIAADTVVGESVSTPDRVADYPGGVAARLHIDDEEPVAGDVFLLMATHGSDAAARAYDQTPFRHDGGVHDDTVESNTAAVEFVEDVTGHDVELVDLTSAPAGGDSGGVAYALGYLDIATEGDFTAGIRVAATGRIRPDGYVEPVSAIDEKTAAAALAGAAVLFTASIPDDATIAAHGARFVGEMRWTRRPDSTLAEERHWDRYQTWGDHRPDGMDVVAIRHIGDAAAYLCGAGSIAACRVVEELADRPDEVATTPSHQVTEGRIT